MCAVCAVRRQDLSGIRISNLDPSLVHRIASSTLPRLPVRVGRVVFFNPPFLFGRSESLPRCCRDAAAPAP